MQNRLETGSTNTKHADIRAQQRGISPFVIDLLMTYGAENRCCGATRYYMDKPARRRMAKAVGEQVLRRIEDLLDTMIVVGDNGLLVTAAHRTTRVRRH